MSAKQQVSHKNGPQKTKSERFKAEEKNGGKTITARHPDHAKIVGLVRHIIRSSSDTKDRRTTMSRSSGPVMVVSVDADGKPTVVEQKSEPTVPRQFYGEREFAKTLLGNRPIAYNLVYNVSQTSSANTALNYVIAADPQLSADISGVLAALFDEMKTVDARCEFVMTTIASGGTAAASPNLLWASCWDPTDGSAETGVLSVLQHTQHLGPIGAAVALGVSAGNGQALNTVVPTTHNGTFCIKSGRIHPILMGDSSGTVATGPIGSNWVPTTSSSAKSGWFKWYVPALGANATSSLSGYITLTTWFRFQT